MNSSFHTSKQSEPEISNHSHVLIVGVDALLAWSLIQTLEKEGYTSTLVNNGEDAMRVLSDQKTTVDCILIDHDPPEIDAAVITPAMKALTNGIPIIVMTTIIDEEDWPEMLMLSSVDGFIEKPFQIHEIVRWIKEIHHEKA